MSSLSEIAVVSNPVPQVGDPADSSAVTATPQWSPIEIPHTRRVRPTALVVLATCAGLGALIMGALAGLSTLSGSEEASEEAARLASAPSAERQVLAMLAKPSTERIPFRGSDGSLVLVVGSAGRAAILMRGVEHARRGQPYAAWVVGAGRPIRAARFDGTERAVFLDVPLASRESVVLAQKRPLRITAATPLLASRG